jgi:hypothetical protein
MYHSFAICDLFVSFLPFRQPNTPLAKYASEITGSKEDIEHIARAYNLENEHIYYQKLVEENALEVVDPKCITQVEGWVPPHPAFQKLQ